MLFRRVKKHVKDHDWFAVWVDFVIVVIGVFIGLQVANWNESRQERQRETHYLQRLDKELDVIRDRLNAGVEVFSRSVRNIDGLLQARRDFAVGNTEALPDDDWMIEALETVTSGRIPAGSPAAFNEMVANGALETLRSDALRQALFEYDDFAKIARAGWATIRDQQHPSTNALTPLVDVTAPEQLAAMVMTGGLDMTPVDFDRQRFLTAAEIGGHLGILLRAQTNQYALVARQLELAEAIEAILAEELR